ncbi:hypothetical protein FH972_026099 [Carpinus fangiana]|uniref:Hexosyltransferase n=1 Tax=Carpinus fangiana TaxID=176857 RepID=A0A5N6L360_9ROSI|nr:hypothetical protein FH972_026099 [Carpinus fangiana]
MVHLSSLGQQTSFGAHASSRRRLAAGTVTVLCLFLFLQLFLPQSDALVPSTSNWRGSVPSDNHWQVPRHKYAFATFLAAPAEELESDDDDRYYVMSRMMAYQVLHDPLTRTREAYPFVVLVSEDVRQSKRERLARDGAVVVPVKRITSDWLKTKNPKWRDMLSKLRLFELTQYDKVAYFDSDTVIVQNLDEIFNDEAAVVTPNLGNPKEAPEDEGKQPSQYIFAGNAGAGGFDHAWPPPPNRKNLNGGCFVYKPSQDMFDYYMRVVNIKDRFEIKYMEQNLLAYVHRREGNMPWKQIHYKWNTNWATFNDTLRGVASLHTKFWENEHDPQLRDICMRSRWQMEGYWNRADLDGA